MKVINFVWLQSFLQGQLPRGPLKTVQVALVPTEDVLLMYGTLPLTSARKLRQAAPFSVEEALIEDIDTLHFALGKQEKTGRFPVAVVKKSLLKTWSEVLSAQGIVPRYMLPEVLALPYTPGSWHVLLLDKRALIRLDAFLGVSVELTQLSTVLPLLLNEYGVPDSVKISYTAAHAEYDIADLAKSGLSFIKADSPTTPEIEFSQGFQEGGKTLNLLESADFLKELRRSTIFQNQHYGKWIRRTFWAVALFWLASQLSLIVIFNHRSQPVEAQIRTLYYSIFPSDTPFNDVQDRINKQLDTVYLAPASFFLNAMIALGAELKNHHGTLVIHRLDLKENTLVLEVTAPELLTLDKMSAALGGQQYTVQITEVKSDAQNEHVTAQIKIGKTV
jgi:general secretion pathway protein L